MIHFILNEKTIATDLPPGMVMLDFIRYHQHLTGTKIGCREGDCGACTVLVGKLINEQLQYESMTSCLMPLGNAQGKHIVSIEGINFAEGLNPIQQAMAEEGGTQCGFCTPGFVMSLAGFCLTGTEPTYQNAIAAIDGNICRCTGYKPIERAAARVTTLLQQRNGEELTSFVSRKKILPAYFASIKAKLSALSIKEVSANPVSDSIVGGGTDLYVQKHEAMTQAAIRFIAADPAIQGIAIEGNRCIIGAAVTVSDMKASAVFNQAIPNFQNYARLVSSTPIRNMATIAGNFINASPIGDLTIFFLALDTQLILSDGTNKRELPLRKLYKGYKSLDKKPEEYIESVWFECPDKNALFNFEKVSKRTHLDIASVNSSILLKMDGDTIGSASIAAGGVGPVPAYLTAASIFLAGKKPGMDLLKELIDIMKTEISPISDARGTKEYKTLLLGKLLTAHFITLFDEVRKSIS